MRVGFLFNHDQIHQVAHSLPIALALARMGTGAEIVVAVTNERLRREVQRMAGDALSRMSLIELKLRRTSSYLIAKLGEMVIPASKLLVYRDNLDFFRSLDMLVVAEKTSLILRERYGLDGLRIVHTRHGAGDRAIGFDRKSALFDHVLVSGGKVKDRLIAETGLSASQISVVGYPKFDVCAPNGANDAMHDDRPVVLYNPHPSPHLSSWYGAGRAILDWFAAREDEYRLLFAPHVMLFERPFVLSIDRLRLNRAGRIDQRFLRASNIRIDLGSRASTTMEYTEAADIYLGDASSQVYEFLRKPRPCVFANVRGVAWRDDRNFAHWSAGPVIERVEELGAALCEARTRHESVYRPIQQRLFSRSFDLDETPSSVRAAKAIAGFAGMG